MTEYSRKREWVKISPLAKEEYKGRIIKKCVAKMTESRQKCAWQMRQRDLTRIIINNAVTEELNTSPQIQIYDSPQYDSSDDMLTFVDSDEHLDLMLQIEEVLKYEFRDDHPDDCANISLGLPDCLSFEENMLQYDIDGIDDASSNYNAIVCPVCRTSEMHVNSNETEIVCIVCGTTLSLCSSTNNRNIITENDSTDNKIQNIRNILADVFDRHLSRWTKNLTDIKPQGINSSSQIPCPLQFQQTRSDLCLYAFCSTCGFYEKVEY
mmetsp:Transcript_6351/g.6567  ORF Transcript_6351/g.6567 Transcript_6351/m.6567 type:complete len:266 (+) Transcript_6351:63-860(+)